jgi:ADP-heptose:LPS heptosyltransferase
MRKNENIYSQIHNKYLTDIKKDCKIYTDRVRKIFPNSNYACLAPFANWPPKEWPTSNFINVAEYLIDKGINKIYILGSKEESSRFDNFKSKLGDKVVNRCGKQHILNDYGLLMKSRLFIGNDSSMMHMAALANTPTIGLFGPTNDGIYFPKIFENCYLVRSKESYEELIRKTENYTLNNCLMEDVAYNEVINNINTILNAQNF